MVAIQHDRVALQTPRPSPHRPHLRVIDGGRSPARMAATFRRRRLVVLAVAVAVGLLAVLGALTVVRAARGLVQPSAPAVSGAAAASPTVVVQPGDTLWTIAERLPHHGDVRPLVDRLAALNGGSQIRPGQRLVVPRG